MSTLKGTIEDLANEFAIRIIGALRAASIEEVSSVTGLRRGPRAPVEARPRTRTRGRGGRLGRRSQADIDRMVDAIVAQLQKSPEGQRAEQLREALACEAKELPRPLAEGLEQGRITKTGQKRATTYFAGGEAGVKKRGRRPRKRAAA